MRRERSAPLTSCEIRRAVIAFAGLLVSPSLACSAAQNNPPAAGNAYEAGAMGGGGSGGNPGRNLSPTACSCPPGAADGGQASGAPSTCYDDGFSPTATAFALPLVAGLRTTSGTPDFPALEGSNRCDSMGTARWTVIDMNGDERPDLLFTQACADPSIGNLDWDVYLNTGTGFSQRDTSFALPTILGAIAPSGEPLLTSLEGSDDCSGGKTVDWSVIDVNGDRKPDFVVTQACNDASVGTSGWEVYPNTGSGFSPTPSPFSLPTIAGAVGASGGPPLTSLDGSTPCSGAKSSAAWSFVDMNGDLLPDFVLTEACTDASVGTSRWQVYLNDGSGFSATATSFALPTLAGALGASGGPPLTSLEGSDDCSGGKTVDWFVVDMNGDNRPDLVVTRSCTDVATGTSSWTVYFNDGLGFSSKAASFSLPTILGLVPSSAPLFASFGGSQSCAPSGSARWSVLDVNGDKKPDWLLTEACNDTAVGTSLWDVYVNTGTGFSATATSFALPAVSGLVEQGGSPPFTSLVGSDDCSGGGAAKWNVLSMNEQGDLGFVLLEACADSTIGNSAWSAYSSSCRR